MGFVTKIYVIVLWKALFTFFHDLLYYIHVGMAACLYVRYVHAVALRGQKGFGSLRTGVESVAELPNVSAGNQTSARGVRYPWATSLISAGVSFNWHTLELPGKESQ